MNYYKEYMIEKVTKKREFSKLINENFTAYSKTDNFFLYNVNIDEIPNTDFKIHLSATINNACSIATRFFSFISNKKINFKIISSLSTLEFQNMGNYGYSQIGKFITIYPRNHTELKELLHSLELIFKGIKSIKIPSDFQYMLSEVVYYRYGEFKASTSFIDKRNRMIPESVHVPIEDYYIKRLNELPSKYIIIDVIKKNAKGGVYKVLNTEDQTFSILKEAVLLGNIDIFNYDAVNRLVTEKKVLNNLVNEKFSPNYLNDFYINNSYFLEIELLEGIPFLECSNKLDYFPEIIDILSDVNNIYKTTYRDISFNNILVYKQRVKLFDFEFAINNGINYSRENTALAGTPGFYETTFNQVQSQPEDIFGLASLLYWSENIDIYKQISNLEYQNAIKSFQEIDLKNIEIYRGSKFATLYNKAFNHLYTDFKEFKLDFLTLYSVNN